MMGYSRHLKSEFDAYNKQAFDRIIQVIDDPSRTAYTFYMPDVDSDYCWAREEYSFTSLMTEEELLTVVPKEKAIEQGMVIGEI